MVTHGSLRVKPNSAEVGWGEKLNKEGNWSCCLIVWVKIVPRELLVAVMLKCSLQTVQTVFIFLYFIMTVLVVVAVEVNVFFTTLVELIFRDNLSAMMTSIKVMKYIDNNHYQYQSFSGVLSGR